MRSLQGVGPTEGRRTPGVAVLLFALGDARFGLLAETVREVVRATAFAPLPGAPAIVAGAINVRGTLVPLLDIRQRFRITPRPLHPSQHFILAWARGRLVALHVETALGLVSIEYDAIAPPGELFSGPGYTAGVARMPDGVLVIHDLDAFLSQAEEEVLASALSSADAPK